MSEGGSGGQKRREERERASDPDTPPRELLELARRHPREVLANPALEMLALTDLGLLLGAPEQAIGAMLSRRDVPSWLLAALGRSEKEEVRRAVLQHPAAPPELLDALAEREGPRGLYALLRNAELPGWVRDRAVARVRAAQESLAWPQGYAERAGPMARRGPESPSSLRLQVLVEEPALAGLSRESVLELLGQSIHAHERLVAARDERCPAELLERLASDPSATVREVVAEHPVAPAGALRRLASDASERVCLAVASRSDLPPEILAQLAQREDPRLLAAVAAQGGLPEARRRALLERLVDSEDPGVRLLAASNPRCTGEQLRRLACDPDASVRASLAGNPSCPPDLRLRLGADPESMVRGCLARFSALPLPPDLAASLARDPEPSTRSWLALSRGCPGDLLARLARDECDEVRRSVASADACPPGVLSLLAGDPSEGVCEAALKHPALPARELAWSAAQTASARLRGAALAALPAGLVEMACSEVRWDGRGALRRLLSRPAPPEAAWFFGWLVRSTDPGVRRAAALAPACPPGLLARLSRDREAAVCLAAARNPSLPEADRRRLSRSRHEAIRAAALSLLSGCTRS